MCKARDKGSRHGLAVEKLCYLEAPFLLKRAANNKAFDSSISSPSCHTEM